MKSNAARNPSKKATRTSYWATWINPTATPGQVIRTAREWGTARVGEHHTLRCEGYIRDYSDGTLSLTHNDTGETFLVVGIQDRRLGAVLQEESRLQAEFQELTRQKAERKWAAQVAKKRKSST